MRVHFILHETFEVPGAYLKWAIERGHQITSTKVYEKEPLPETIDGIDFLIVMGGPQSPDEDRENFPYYDPKAELAFMKEQIAGTSIQLIMVGGTKEELLIFETDIPPNIHIIPFLEKLDILELMRVVDLFVLPTYSDTWGLVIVEALSAGES